MSNFTRIIRATNGIVLTGLDALTNELTQIFHDELNIEIESVDQDLIEEGLLDSLSLVEMLLILEQEFGIEVSIVDIDFDEFRSVRNLANFVANSASVSSESPAA